MADEQVVKVETLKELYDTGFMSTLSKAGRQLVRNIAVSSNVIGETLEVADSKVCKHSAIEITKDRLQVERWINKDLEPEEQAIAKQVLKEQKDRRIC